MATIDDVKAAYLAVNRTAISDAQAQAFAAAIDGGSLTLDQFIANQINSPSGKITQAEVATYALLTGNVSSSAQLDALAAFGTAQASYYAAHGFNAALAPFEALGAAIASDPTTKAAFATKFGGLSDKDFISTLYIAVEGGIAPTFTGNPNTGSGDHFLAQLAFYTNLYISAGVPAADAALRARGAIAGQIAALPFTDSASAVNSSLDDQTVAFLTAAAHGTATYSAPLPAAPPVPGTTFTLSVNADGPGAVAPAVNTTGTDKADTYNSIIGASSTLNSSDTIDGKGGSDRLNVRVMGSGAAVAPTLTSVETVAITMVQGGDMQELNLAGATGVTKVVNANTVQATTAAFSNVAPTVTASLEGVAGNTTTIVVYTGAAGRSGTADGFSLNVSGSGAAGNPALFSIDADPTFEVANITATGNGSVIRFASTSLDTIKVAGAASALASTGYALVLSGGLDLVKTVDASGLTAAGLNIDLGSVGNTQDVTFTGSAFNDAVKMGLGLTPADKLDGGAGTNIIGVTDGGTLVSGLQVTNFETLDIGSAFSSSTYDMSKLPGITTLLVSANVNQDIGAQIETINNLAKGAGITINAALGFPGDGDGVVVNVKDAGAGSPNDVIAVNLSAPSGFSTFGSLTINDIETVNLTSTSSGASVGHTLTSLIDAAAKTVNVNASTAALGIGALVDTALVQFDASASVKAVSLTTGANAYTANGGVAFTLGAAADILALGGATFASPTKGAIVTGNGGGDNITLEAAGYVDTIVLKAATDSQAAVGKIDLVNFFDAAGGDRIDLKAFGFTGGLATSFDKVPSVAVGIFGEVAAADATNFFVDAGKVKHGVAEVASGGDSFIYIDVDKDGNFSATADAVLLVSAVTPAMLAGGNYVFA